MHLSEDISSAIYMTNVILGIINCLDRLYIMIHLIDEILNSYNLLWPSRQYFTIGGPRLEEQSVTNIFEYSNILVTNIYSDIRSYQFFFYESIWTFVRVKFVCTNIFGHSLVSVLECKTKTNIQICWNFLLVMI